MTYRILALCALATLTVLEPARVWGHGFTLSLSGNNLVTHSDDPPLPIPPELVPNDRAFVENLDDVLGVLQTDAGGPGGGTAFVQNRHFSFEVLGPLWFSNGGDATPAANGAKMTIVDQQAGFGGQRVLTGADVGLQPILPISGRTSHEFIWQLTGTPAAGAYGIVYRVHGGQNGGDDFGTTPWILSVYATPGFADTGNLDLAAAKIIAAAVPEPASVAMLSAGLAAAVGAALHRRRTRKVSRGLRQAQSAR